MVWFRVDDGFYDHPKLLAIPRTDRVAAAGLWTLAGSYCTRYLTDGFITDVMTRQLGGTARLIAHLVDVEAVDTCGRRIPVLRLERVSDQPHRGRSQAQGMARPTGEAPRRTR